MRPKAEALGYPICDVVGFVAGRVKNGECKSEKQILHCAQDDNLFLG